MIKVIFVWALMICTLLVIFVPLYHFKDSHIGLSNVCNELFYPDICGKVKH